MWTVEMLTAKENYAMVCTTLSVPVIWLPVRCDVARQVSDSKTDGERSSHTLRFQPGLLR